MRCLHGYLRIWNAEQKALTNSKPYIRPPSGGRYPLVVNSCSEVALLFLLLTNVIGPYDRLYLPFALIANFFIITGLHAIGLFWIQHHPYESSRIKERGRQIAISLATFFVLNAATIVANHFTDYSNGFLFLVIGSGLATIWLIGTVYVEIRVLRSIMRMIAEFTSKNDSGVVEFLRRISFFLKVNVSITLVIILIVGVSGLMIKPGTVEIPLGIGTMLIDLLITLPHRLPSNHPYYSIIPVVAASVVYCMLTLNMFVLFRVPVVVFLQNVRASILRQEEVMSTSKSKKGKIRDMSGGSKLGSTKGNSGSINNGPIPDDREGSRKSFIRGTAISPEPIIE
jgi:hypothetical protein